MKHDKNREYNWSYDQLIFLIDPIIQNYDLTYLINKK